MYGYTIYAEAQLLQKASEARALAGEINALAAELKEQISSGPKIWSSSTGLRQTDKCWRKINALEEQAAMLNEIANELVNYTIEHKTWLEELIDVVDDLLN